MTAAIYGYFNDLSGTPAYDPGLGVDCPVCHTPLCLPLVTISLMLPGDTRSYFYRAHKGCYSRLSADAQTELDSVLIDALAMARNTN
jgi:hypothetical protein